jgi:hypothetical protein
METHERWRVARQDWAKRVERWRDTGLSCAEFAAELGVNTRTLTCWKWMLNKEARGEERVWPTRKDASAAHCALFALGLSLGTAAA